MYVTYPLPCLYGRSARFLSSYLKAILSRDRRAYGTTQDPAAAVRSEDAATAGEESLIQQRIEDFIEGPSVP